MISVTYDDSVHIIFLKSKKYFVKILDIFFFITLA